MNDYLRRVRRAAIELGYRVEQRKGHGGADLYVLPDGTTYNGSSSPSEWRGVLNVIADLEKLAGKKCARPNAGHHRHKPKRGEVLDFSKARTINESWSAAWGDHVEAFVEELRRCRVELKAMRDNPRRVDVERFRLILARARYCEWSLRKYHQPVTPLSLADL